MLSLNLQCESCGNFFYKGSKFNMIKEDVKGCTYLGLKIYRFSFRCGECNEVICLKTDPKNREYSIESGAFKVKEKNFGYAFETSSLASTEPELQELPTPTPDKTDFGHKNVENISKILDNVH